MIDTSDTTVLLQALYFCCEAFCIYCLVSVYYSVVTACCMELEESFNAARRHACVMVQYFRELQSLLQQFIIVEHAVDPAVDPSAAAGADQQQLMDEATLEAMNAQAAAAESGVETDAAATGMDMATTEAEDMPMMDTSADPSAMDTSSSADNQMAFEEDPQPPAEPFTADETGPSDIA